MSRELSSIAQAQIDAKDIKAVITFKINSTDRSSVLDSYSVSFDKNFGSAAASFTINNNDGDFSNGGDDEIKVGDIVELFEQFEGDTYQYKKFYGIVDQVSVNKSATARTVLLTCLDYISKLKHYDIDLDVEGTKVEVTNETLTPNFLAAPNENLAQVFDFANNSIASDPAPIFLIKDVDNLNEDPQYDGFNISYAVGQVKLGSPLNANLNYDLIARKYYYYSKGKYVEDVLEEIITLEDGYGQFLFNESSAADVITNHLTTTINTEEGTSTDTMTPNLTSSTITIETNLTVDVTAGDTSISVTSTDGFPTSGTGEINGDIFTWTGKTGTTLTGIPATGASSLNAHNSGDYVEYEDTYDAGQVWYLRYSNVQTDMTSSDFTLPSGGSFSYFDKRFGRIILNSAISVASSVTCDTNYTFKTLQASGIEINQISFRPRELANAFEAINKIRAYIAPNYIIRTQGDDLVWASYLSQRTVSDYDLELVKSVTYLGDEDLYTRVVMYTKNSNPTNIVFNDGVGFYSTGESFRGITTQTELSYDRDEGNYYVYTSPISGAGYIDIDSIKPVVYINNVAIDDNVHQIVGQNVQTEVTTKTEVKSGCHGLSSESYTKLHNYYYYKIFLAHSNIEPSQPIIFYNAFGVEVLTVSANDVNMDYGRGIYMVPGDNRKTDIESISTATYSVFYSLDSLIIDYDNVEFKVAKGLVPEQSKSIVTATFEYWTVMVPIHDIASVIDGRWDTQVQVEFYTEPPDNYPLTILDLGAVYSIQALDVVAGFFRPDDIRKFDIDMRFTLQYSTDGVDYFNIGDKAENISLSGGQSFNMEEKDLGTDFEARYIRVNLNYVRKIDFAGGIWVAAFSELSVYGDIILRSEASLISTTQLTVDVNPGDTVVNVANTSGFDELESGETEKTAYIGEDSFTYTGFTSTTFTGCVTTGISALTGTRVSQTLETSTTLYDDDGLLPQLGDRVFKDIRISDEALYDQEQTDDLAKDFLKEYYKDHSKQTASIMFAPYLSVGHTISVTDSYQGLSDEKRFIESVSNNQGTYSVVVAKYPS